MPDRKDLLMGLGFTALLFLSVLFFPVLSVGLGALFGN
jgi:nitrate reductase NapE component